jgi:hypothetical protein
VIEEEDVDDEDSNIEDIGKFDLTNITLYDEDAVLKHDVSAMSKYEKKKL